MGTLFPKSTEPTINVSDDLVVSSITESHDHDLDDSNDSSPPEMKLLLRGLPTTKGWRTKHLYLYQNFWCQAEQILAIHAAQTHHQARDSDVVIATVPKSGTTWLKALVYTIVRRDDHLVNSVTHPLLTHNPHDLIPFLEYKLYNHSGSTSGSVHGVDDPVMSMFDKIPGFVATHVPYASLPESVKTSGCKIVYICRNPFDTFVSIWHFMKDKRPKTLGPFTISDAFDKYCKGEVGFGPYWDHMLGYWNKSKTSPNKVMFLKYEDLKRDDQVGFVQIKRLAEFLGYGFTDEEKRNGIVEEVARLCSFDNLKRLEVNKSGRSILPFENRSLFRKGEVGDWVNHLSKEMVERLKSIMDEKLGGSGLEFFYDA